MFLKQSLSVFSRAGAARFLTNDQRTHLFIAEGLRYAAKVGQSVGLGFTVEHGSSELIEGVKRYLHCSGQVAVVPHADSEMGIKIMHPNEIRGQMEDSLADIDAVLEQAGLTRENIVTLRFFTTDIDGFLANYDVYADWIAEAGTRPPQSLLGVNRLVLPELTVEIEALAAE